MKKLFLIGGTMGVGKTTICQNLKKRLFNSVYLDGDWCWNANPFKVTDETKKMVIDNICYLLNNFLQCSEYENIIFSWVMHKQTIIDTIMSKINANNYQLIDISLISDEQTIKKRLLNDINSGLRTMDVIERSIEKIPLYKNLSTIKIDTSNQSVDETVQAIINITNKQKCEMKRE